MLVLTLSPMFSTAKTKFDLVFRLLLDGLVLVFLGGTSLLSSTGNSVFQLFVLGAYFFLYGVSNIRDGFLFEEEIGEKPSQTSQV